MKTSNFYHIVFLFFIIFLSSKKTQAQTDPNQPNILLIIADDLGVDYTNGYHNSPMLPVTPNLDALQTQGITFDNAWAAPQCTPTRAAIMSGKHGIKTGATEVPAQLDPNTHISIFRELATQTNNAYADALIGKWHIAPLNNYNGPTNHGVDYFAGRYGGGVQDYYNWGKVENGVESTVTNYATNEFTDDAIDWIANRNSPWFLWLAHTAPHSPYHTPPDSMYTTGGGGGNNRNYIRAIEAMDHSIGRLFDNIDPAVLANTLVIYIGDNGTPSQQLQNYPNGLGKGNLHQGGIHVPLIVAGKGVTRTGEREDALVNATDIYATILETAGADLPGGMYNSLSFNHLLDNSPGDERPYNYMEYTATNRAGWTIRDAQYKYIDFDNEADVFYDLVNDPYEETNLINNLTTTQQTILADMQTEGNIIRNDWSCQDFIQNGTETAVDQGSINCGDETCNTPSDLNFSNIGCCVIDSPTPSQYSEIIYQGVRTISSNTFPNHDYCHTTNNVPAPKYALRQVPANPQIAASTTSVLSSTNRPDRFFGIALNGVIYAPAPATPFIFEDQNTGEFNWDWVFEPINNIGGNGWVSLDCASAHTGPQGYHYHGNMFEYAENIQAGLSTTTTPPNEPIQVGWASDGFPILYRFGPDANGDLTLLQPSFQLKPGNRPGDGITAPCGPYNGKYTNDYEYVQGAGDLDECNGVARSITLETQHGGETFDYFYMITDSFPQISRCMVGTPDLSFDNSAPSNTCYTSLVSQTVVLENGQSVTVGNNTYTIEGIYQDILTNAEGCDSIVVTEVSLSLYVDITLKAFLEGPYDSALGEMTTDLNARGILPGQTPASPIATSTPAGQPYHITPWNYSGMEGMDWTDSDYSGDETDWVLVSFRTGTAKNTEIAMTAALLKKDGTFHFPDRNVVEVGAADSVYVVIEHRNHIGIMTPYAVEIANGVLVYDFTLDDSYRDATGFGQKQTPTGEWVMFAGDASQFDMPSFDINGIDKAIWVNNNGVFDYYSSPDFDLNGDVTGQDKSLWFDNNGTSSRVPK